MHKQKKEENLGDTYPEPIFSIFVYLRLGSPTDTMLLIFSIISSSDIFFFLVTTVVVVVGAGVIVAGALLLFAISLLSYAKASFFTSSSTGLVY